MIALPSAFCSDPRLCRGALLHRVTAGAADGNNLPSVGLYFPAEFGIL